MFLGVHNMQQKYAAATQIQKWGIMLYVTPEPNSKNKYTVAILIKEAALAVDKRPIHF